VLKLAVLDIVSTSWKAFRRADMTFGLGYCTGSLRPALRYAYRATATLDFVHDVAAAAL